MLPYRIAPLLFFNRSKALWSAIKEKVFHFIYFIFIYFFLQTGSLYCIFDHLFLFIRAHFTHPIHAEMLEQATEERHRKVLWANIG